jgi:hypothetical protein
MNTSSLFLALIAGLKLPTRIAYTMYVQVTFKETGISPSRPMQRDGQDTVSDCPVLQAYRGTESNRRRRRFRYRTSV